MAIYRRPPRAPGRSNWVRRWLGLIVLAAMLFALGVVVAVTGWEGWLARHPGQAWRWIVGHWFVPSAMAVFVALLGVWVTWAGPRRQQRRAEQLAAEQRTREDAKVAQAEAQAAGERQAAWEQRCRAILACWPLPKVAEANPYQLGVFYSRRAEAYRGDQSRPPYVPRAADDELAELLRSRPLVLIKGQSRAGKSRTAFEVAARELGEWRLLAPIDRAALAGLADLEPLPGEGEPVLVWLDDLDQFLAVEGDEGLNTALLGRWAACSSPVKVLATIRLEEYGRLIEAPGELGRNVRELLNRFDPGAITLPTTFDDPAEEAAVVELYAGEQVSGGLAEHLAAAHELVDRLEVGQVSVPEGAGLVLAAVDCRRAGLDRPISKADLAALLPLYLQQLRPLVPFQEGDVDRGLGWATEPVGRTAALLIADPDPLSGTFRVAEPIVDYAERRQGRKLAHAAVWEYLLARASLEEALDISFVAFTRAEQSIARSAFSRIANSRDRTLAPIAALALGVLLADQGDVVGAKAAYQQAINSKRRGKSAVGAAFGLARLLAGEGDAAGAEAAYRRVINSGDPQFAPEGAIRLGMLLEEQGDAAGAEAAYRQAVDSGHPEVGPRAVIRLGILLEDQEDIVGAKGIYQQAIDSGHTEVALQGAIRLGRLLGEQGDAVGAEAAYRQVIDSDHPELSSAARFNLGRLLVEQGDVAGAEAVYRQVIDSGLPELAPQGAVHLGMLLAEQGDVAGAEAVYRQAVDSGHPEVASRAAIRLGTLLGQQGDVIGAQAAYQQAVDFGDPKEAPWAAFHLAELLTKRADVVGAGAAYRRVIDSGHPELAPAAQGNLGLLLEKQGDATGAEAAFRRAIDSGHPMVAPAAAANLGHLLERQGDAVGAEAAYRQAVDSGHPGAAPRAAIDLGTLLEKRGDVIGARAVYQQAIDFAHPEVTTTAQQRLQGLEGRR
jgi:tetratricopeptide (TPR) repeat protein